jgi:hypothetical protein
MTWTGSTRLIGAADQAHIMPRYGLGQRTASLHPSRRIGPNVKT